MKGLMADSNKAFTKFRAFLARQIFLQQRSSSIYVTPQRRSPIHSFYPEILKIEWGKFGASFTWMSTPRALVVIEQICGRKVLIIIGGVERVRWSLPCSRPIMWKLNRKSIRKMAALSYTTGIWRLLWYRAKLIMLRFIYRYLIKRSL